jgi:hypothetical protein
VLYQVVQQTPVDFGKIFLLQFAKFVLLCLDLSIFAVSVRKACLYHAIIAHFSYLTVEGTLSLKLVQKHFWLMDEKLLQPTDRKRRKMHRSALRGG